MGWGTRGPTNLSFSGPQGQIQVGGGGWGSRTPVPPRRLFGKPRRIVYQYPKGLDSYPVPPEPLGPVEPGVSLSSYGWVVTERGYLVPSKEMEGRGRGGLPLGTPGQTQGRLRCHVPSQPPLDVIPPQGPPDGIQESFVIGGSHRNEYFAPPGRRPNPCRRHWSTHSFPFDSVLLLLSTGTRTDRTRPHPPYRPD